MLGVVLPFLRARQKSPPSVILYQKRALPAVQAIGLGLGFRGMSLMNAAGRPGFPFALRTLPSPPRLHPALHMHDTHTHSVPHLAWLHSARSCWLRSAWGRLGLKRAVKEGSMRVQCGSEPVRARAGSEPVRQIAGAEHIQYQPLVKSRSICWAT